MDNFNVLVGGRIRSLREVKGYSREYIANNAGISASYLYEIEVGAKSFSARIMHDISITLGVTTDYLIYGELHDGEYKILISLLSGLDKSEIVSIEEIIRKVRGFKY